MENTEIVAGVVTGVVIAAVILRNLRSGLPGRPAERSAETGVKRRFSFKVGINSNRQDAALPDAVLEAAKDGKATAPGGISVTSSFKTTTDVKVDLPGRGLVTLPPDMVEMIRASRVNDVVSRMSREFGAQPKMARKLVEALARSLGRG